MSHRTSLLDEYWMNSEGRLPQHFKNALSILKMLESARLAQNAKIAKCQNTLMSITENKPNARRLMARWNPHDEQDTVITSVSHTASGRC